VAFERVIADLGRLYEAQPETVACDAHPDYLSTQYAERSGRPLVRVQHHYAHVLACMAEHELDAPVLGVSWDGSGDGMDGTVWGGEFLRVTAEGFRRVASLRPFPLPGGEQAVREPRRAALGLLYAIFEDALFDRENLAPVAACSPAERQVLRQMLRRGVNTPLCSSAGRLFDAVASILSLRQRCSFEGQAAMELEFLVDGTEGEEAYDLPVAAGPADGSRGGAGLMRLDWEPMVRAALRNVHDGVPAPVIAARFHNALVDGIAAVARRVGEERVVLTGGCFQNGYLTERTVACLRREGFRPYWHQRIPPNDGGVALGQIVAAIRAQAPEVSVAASPCARGVEPSSAGPVGVESARG
jgi:hydrogenase maturation protein HypF